MAAIAAIWISDRNDCSYFYLHRTPIFPTKFRVNWSSVQEKKRKIDFQDGGHGDHLAFSIGTILVIFDLQVSSILFIKFLVDWPV